MIDSLDEAVRCAEDALADLDGTRFELVAALMRFLDLRAEDCLGGPDWGPDTGAAAVHLGRLLLELGLRQEADRMFRLLSRRLQRLGVPEPLWAEQGEPFINCLGVLGIALGRQAEALDVLGRAPRDDDAPLSPAAVATRVNLAAVEAGLGHVDEAVGHALEARAMIDRLPEDDGPARRALHTALDTVEHQLLGFAPPYGDHAARTVAALARRTGRILDELDDSDPRAHLALADFAVVRAGAAVEAGDAAALETVVKVLEITAQRLAARLGADHPKALTVQADLAAVQIEAARCVRSAARLERAVELLGATARRLEIHLGPAHPRTVGALTDLVAAEVETVRALPEPGKAQRTADALAERALRFVELLGAGHPVTRLVSASAATCRRMAAGDDGGRDLGGTTLVRTLVDAPGNWQDGEVYRSFPEAVNAVGRPAPPFDVRALIDFGAPRAAGTPERAVEALAVGSLAALTVLHAGTDEVEGWVDDWLDGGPHAVVPPGELPLSDAGHPQKLSVGQPLRAVVIGVEGGAQGRVILSLRESLLEEAGRREALARDTGLPSAGATLSGLVLRVVDGGLEVEVGDGTGFLPAADIEAEPVGDPQEYVGRVVDVKAWLTRTGSVVLSRRAWLEEADALPPQEWLAHVQVGQVRTGKVLRLHAPDVVLDLGGFQGLLDPDDPGTGTVAVGDLVMVRVSAVDRARGRVYAVLLPGGQTS